MNKRFMLLLFAALWSIQLNAQRTPADQVVLNTVAPASPSVAALGKYGDVPVGYYTGTPNISVPLYHIQLKDLDLPISLSYHASGIKVEEIASSVGLGWALNACGVITRQVRGMPDDDPNQYIDNANNSNAVTTILGPNNYVSIPQLAALEGYSPLNTVDTEPDIFFFNFGKWSGKFFYHQPTKQFICMSHQKMRISFTKGNSIGKWVITVEDGTTYTFTGTETSYSQNLCLSLDAPSNLRGYVTSWFLTKIENPSKSEEIDLTYNPANNHFLMLGSASIYRKLYGPEEGTPPQDCFTNVFNDIYTQQLSEITYPGGKIKFDFMKCRADLNGEKELDSIEIYQGDQLWKKIGFNYGYFGGTPNPAVNYCDASQINMQNAVNFRLKLLSVSTTSADGAQALPPYVFSYQDVTPLPSRLSCAQDHWGYYNGQTANTTLIPTFVYPYGSGYYQYQGAERSPNANVTKACVLTGITYPTGGRTNFEYENNEVVGDADIPGQLVTREMGLRKEDLVPGQTAQKTFVINNSTAPGAFVTYTYNFQGSCIDLYPHCVEMHVYDSNNQMVLYIQDNATGQVPVFLPNGTYTVKYFTTAGTQMTNNNVADITWQETMPATSSIQNVIVGGLRIKKIEDLDINGATTSSRYFKYNFADTSQMSSGVLLELPNYTYEMNYMTPSPGLPQNSPFDPGVLCRYLVRSSYTNYPLATTQGSHVTYNRVTVYYGDESGSNGRSVFEYTNEGDYTNANSGFPFAPRVNNEHLRGLLLRQTDYRKAGADFYPVKKLTNTYTTVHNLISKGIRIGAATIYAGPIGHIDGEQYVYQIYNTDNDWVYLSATTERTYDQLDTAKYLESTTNYTYDPGHLQQTQITTVDSRGQQTITQLKHPGDYTDSNADAVVKLMKGDRFMHSAVLQKTVLQADLSGTPKVVASQITRYDTLPGAAPGYVVPKEIALLEPTQPVDPANTTEFPPYIPANGYNTAKFKRRAVYQYENATGNIAQMNKENDVIDSYIWGYSGVYPIAECKNALRNECYYTGFEDDGVTGTAHTGKKYYSGSFTTTDKLAPGLNGKTYVITYWYLSAGKWVFSGEKPYTGQTLSGNLDDIRIYPQDAQMTTYTYDPQIGVTSQCDPKSQMTFYEYDGLGRLKLVKDNDGKILKQYDYQYQQPVTQ